MTGMVYPNKDIPGFFPILCALAQKDMALLLKQCYSNDQISNINSTWSAIPKNSQLTPLCGGKDKKWSFLFGVSPERGASASATGVELLRALSKARRKLFDSQKRLSKIWETKLSRRLSTAESELSTTVTIWANPNKILIMFLTRILGI